jgi:phage-related protein
MTLEVFPATLIPAIGASRAAEPRWKRARFNDEIEQARTDGAQLQQVARTWKLRWQSLTQSQANQIDEFLLEQSLANAAFLWTPPGPGYAEGPFRCSAWEKTYDSCRVANVTAEFREDWN